MILASDHRAIVAMSAFPFVALIAKFNAVEGASANRDSGVELGLNDLARPSGNDLDAAIVDCVHFST